MVAVVNCPIPKRVLRLWNRVIIDFTDEKDALALEQALAEARLHFYDPDEYLRRYLAAHGVTDCVSNLE